MPQKGQLRRRRGDRCQILDTIRRDQDRIRLPAGLTGRYALISIKNSFVDVSRRPSPSMTVTSGTVLQCSPFSTATDCTIAVICLDAQNNTDRLAQYSSFRESVFVLAMTSILQA